MGLTSPFGLTPITASALTPVVGIWDRPGLGPVDRRGVSFWFLTR
jgi:hypothetical protein